MMALVKTVFLLPVEDNDGRTLAVEIKTVQHLVFGRFGGWTREGRVSGVFRMADGSPKQDECEKYMVFLDESRLEELEQILRDFKAKTTQEAIYLEIQSNVEIRLL